MDMDRTVIKIGSVISVHKNELNLHFYRPATEKENSLLLGDIKKKIHHQYTKNRKDGTVVYHG